MKRKRFTRVLSILLSFVLIVSLLPINTLADSDEPVVAKLNNRGFKEVVELGVAASDVALTSAVFGKENGRDVVYATANGGMFNVVDVKDNKLIFSKQLGDISQVWSHAIAPDGTVYIAGLGVGNIGELWSYSPSSKTVKKIGVPADGHQLWSSTTDEFGNVYLGTFADKDGRVIKYDVASNTFVDYGKIDDGEGSYVRSLGYHDGYLYAGLGVAGKVFKINVETKEKEDITKNVPDIIGKPIDQVKFAYDMAVVGDYLFVRFDEGGEGAILFYDLRTQTWVDKKLAKLGDGSEDDYGAFGFIQLPVNGDKAYVIYNRHILEVDINTLETRETGIRYAAGWRGGAFVDLGREDFPGLSLVSMTRAGQVFVANLDTNKTTNLPTVMEAKPLQLHNLGKGPDGNLYMTTYPGGPKGARYNPKTNQFISYSQGQAEGLVAGNGSDMYFGIYPGAVIQKMNTDTLETQTLFNIKETYEQDRPYIMKFEHNKLLIGTIPDYKKLGGSLTIYDPVTLERETYRNVVQDQSIVGLASNDGKIYGSTSIRGGLDIQPTASKAKMFVWDVEGKQKITEFELNIPDLDAPPMISGLTFDNDGLLWGAVDGILFAMNPDTYEIVKYKNYYPNVKNRGMWRPVHIEFGKDGLLYTDLAGKLTVVDPKSEDLKHVTLIDSAPEVDFMVLAEDAQGNENIYFLDNSTTVLKMVPVIEGGTVVDPEEPVYEVVEVPITNAGFEEAVDGNTIPGWSSLFGDFSTNATFGVSNERSKNGENSLKVVDTAQNETVFAQSDLIPIEAGIEYTASSQLFLEDGSVSFFLRYFDESGKQVGSDKDGVNIIHIRGGHKEWQTVKATVLAPDGAKYARVFVGASNYFTTNGAYFDDVSLTYQREVEEPEEPTEPRIVQVPITNHSFESAVDDTIPGWSSLFGNFSANAKYEISNTRSKTGDNSLKIIDTAQNETVFAQSDLIPIKAGIEYTGSAELFLEDGSVSFFLRYFDEAGKQVGSDKDGVNIIHIRGGHGEWQTVKATVVAPDGAKYARLFAGASNYFTTNGAYYDDFALTYETNEPLPSIIDLEVDETEVELEIGDEYQINVHANYDDGSSVDVAGLANYESSKTDVVTVDASGKVTVVGPGTAQVIVSYEGKSVTIVFTVAEPAPTLTGIEVDEPTVELEIGAEYQIEAQANYDDGTTADITGLASYESTNTEVVNVDASGKVSAVGAGNAQIVVTYEGHTVTVDVTVPEPAPTLTGIEVEETTVELEIGAEYQIEAQANYDDGTTVDITGLASYESTNAEVVTVDASGKVTAAGAGTAQIVVTYEGHTVTVDVTVPEPAPILTGIEVDEPTVELEIGGEYQIEAQANYDDGTTVDLSGLASYESTNAEVVTVDASGKVTAVGAGTAQVIVTYEGHSVTIDFTVPEPAPTLTGVEVDEPTVELEIGAEYQIEAQANYDDGTTSDLSGLANYESTNTDIVTVDASGKVTAVGAGKAQIIVTYEGHSVTIDFTVQEKEEQPQPGDNDDEDNEDPTDEETPGNTDDTDDSDDQNGNTDKDDSNELPSTATNTYLWLLIGFILLGFGTITRFTLVKRSN